MNRLVIVGAGGHGRSVADNALKNGYKDICFVDDGAAESCLGFPVIGKIASVDSLDDGKTDFVIAIGNNNVRRNIAEKHDVNWVSLVHPSAQIAVQTSIGKGTVVMAGVAVNACAHVGEHCIVNTGAVIEHDNRIADFVHISPNAALGGNVRVDTNTHVGVGAVTINNIKICSDCMIGAGAVIVRDIVESGTYVGVPARKIK